MKVLIVGDSFAADWAIKYPAGKGWPNLLAKHVCLVNLAQAGCSQYRIIQQLKSANLDDFDWIIVCHTSPHRIVTRQHPIHVDGLQACSDLIFADLEYHQKNLGQAKNPSLTSAYDFFRFHYDEGFQDFVYDAVLRSIAEISENRNKITVSTPLVPSYIRADVTISAQDMEKNAANHLSDAGNLKMYQQICSIIHA